MTRAFSRAAPAFIATFAAVPLAAQEPPQGAAQSANEEPEIVVTATRREGSLQDAPLAISAYGEQVLKDRSIASVEEVGAIAPGVQIARYQGDTSIYIRGIGTPTIIAGNDSSTAAYLNGTFLSRAAAVGPAFFDVERIEVLRGPQGTLYGRNATGGAVNIVTRRPTDTLEGDARLTVGNFDLVRFSGGLGGPISDGLRARIAFQAEDRDGFATLIRPDNSTQDADDARNIAARLTIEADLGPDAILTLSGDYFRADDRANVFHFASSGYAQEVPNWSQSREGQQTFPYFAIKNAGRVTPRKSRDLFADVPYFNEVEVWGITGQIDWDIGDYGLQLLSSYRETTTSSQNEFDLSDSFNTRVGRAEDHWQFTADVQLSSPAGDAFSWVAGASYFREDNIIDNDVFGDFWEPILIQGLTDLQTAGVLPRFPVVLPQTTACCNLQLSGQQQTEAFAVFADAELALSDRLTLRAGGRYAREQRDGAQRFELLIDPDVRFAPVVAFFPDAVTDVRGQAVPDPFGFVVAPVNGPTSFNAFTPKVGLDFKPSDDVLVYATIQRGFKSGGYNIGSSQLDAFEPEKIWSYEVGLKGSFIDGAVDINAAAFFYDYTNLQAQDSVANQPIIRNVGQAEVLGFEVESLARLGGGFQIEANATYLDATFTQGELTESLRPAPLNQPPGSLVRDLDGLRLPRAPEWKLGGALQWKGSAANGAEILARLSYVWQSEIFFTVFNIDAASEPSYGLLDARLAYTAADGRWSVAAFGKNLTNETYFTNQILTGTVYGAEFVGPLGPPRTYGVELAYRF